MGIGRLGPGRQSRIARAVAAVALAAVVLVATLASGRTFLWCGAMERAMATCCCPVDDADAVRTEGPALRTACCDVRSFGDLPAGAAASAALQMPPAPLAFVALPALPTPEIAARACAEASNHAPVHARYGLSRAGPHPSARARAALLQVFRC
jgi:hypothetical protein